MEVFSKKTFKNVILFAAATLIISLFAFFGKNDSYAAGKYDRHIDDPISYLNGSDDYKEEAEYLTEWFKLNGYGNHSISNPRKMYSLDDELIAICFDIDNTGYVIINTINYDIMEYSFEGSIAGKQFNKLVYTGFTSVFGKIDEGRLCFIATGEVVPVYEAKESAMDFSSLQRKPLAQKMFAIKSGKGEVARPMGGNDYHESGSLKKDLVKWSSSYYCHVDSASILLRYWYDNKSSKFLVSGSTTNTKVQKYLCDNKYLVDGWLNGKSVVDGGEYWGQQYVGSQLEKIYTKGISKYLKDRGVTGYSATYCTYSFSTIKTQVNADRPVVVGTPGGIPGGSWSGAHAVVAHGYKVGYDGVPFINVNDTFGKNGVSINGSSSYYGSRYMWYIK